MMPARTAAALRAFTVHAVTASGAALGLFALLAAARGQWSWMFLWLGIALIIDGIDGTLARRFKVRETLPRWSGEMIDSVVDFTTYVLVPAFALATGGLLPPLADIVLPALVVASAAIYFADQAMKTPGNFFRGFPALWNLVAFYLFLLHPPPVIAAIAIAAFIVLTFVPVLFVHPVRVRRWRSFNLVLLGVWSALAIDAVLRDLAPAAWSTAALCLIGLYFFAFGLMQRDSATR